MLLVPVAQKGRNAQRTPVITRRLVVSSRFLLFIKPLAYGKGLFAVINTMLPVWVQPIN